MADERNTGHKIPVTEEVLVVGRKTVDSGAVNISKTTETTQALVDEPVFTEEVRVERRRVDRPVPADDPPAVRTEGDTTIIPLLEEVVVVERRLVVREELRITRVRTAGRVRQEVPLRREEVHVERSPVRDDAVRVPRSHPDEPDRQEPA